MSVFIFFERMDCHERRKFLVSGVVSTGLMATGVLTGSAYCLAENVPLVHGFPALGNEPIAAEIRHYPFFVLLAMEEDVKCELVCLEEKDS